MVSRRGRMLWALAVLLVLAGCTSAEGEETTPPTVSESPSDTVTDDPTGDDDASGGEDPSGEPSEPPEIEAPERPAEMDEETVDGAIAAAKYFIELYPYIYATGDLTDWEALSDAGCGFCTNVSDQVVQLDEDGGHAEGVGTEIYSEYGGGPYSDDVYIVDLGVRFSASTFVDGEGTQTDYDAEDRPEFSLSLVWRQSAWLVLGIDAGEQA